VINLGYGRSIVLYSLVRIPVPLHDWSMNIANIDATGFETLSISEPDKAVRRPGWLRAQFWSCVIIGCLLVLHGAWLLYGPKYMGTESLERQFSHMIAAMYGLMLPTFAYLARQAWQSRRTGQRAATIER